MKVWNIWRADYWTLRPEETRANQAITRIRIHQGICRGRTRGHMENETWRMSRRMTAIDDAGLCDVTLRGTGSQGSHAT